MRSIYSVTMDSLKKFFTSHGYKEFKAKQVYDWLYKKKVHSFDDMYNISKKVIELLKENFYFDTIKLITKTSAIDVSKFLFQVSNDMVEAVCMYHDYGISLCISTQVGCNMGCSFCESGRLKKVRNLEISEMVLQILKVEDEIKNRISRVVLMGIGEPFDNYDNVISFIDIINDANGIALGSRHITISTCGIVPKIKKFMEYDKQVNLAISLHAPNDEIRNKIMNINKVYNIDLLIKTLKEYIKKTNRRVTFEYIMLKDVNDTKKCALLLSDLLKQINCYVNLIPYNETSHIEYKKSPQKNILAFYDILKKNNINVTIRREFGSKVNAACGQLRANYEEDL